MLSLNNRCSYHRALMWSLPQQRAAINQNSCNVCKCPMATRTRAIIFITHTWLSKRDQQACIAMTKLNVEKKNISCLQHRKGTAPMSLNNWRSSNQPVMLPRQHHRKPCSYKVYFEPLNWTSETNDGATLQCLLSCLFAHIRSTCRESNMICRKITDEVIIEDMSIDGSE